MQGWSGSTLYGTKTNGWLEGEARSILPNGVVYEGQFKGGNFHGKGVLIYPDGGRYSAEWKEGLAVRGHYNFKDGLSYEVENWGYLGPTDRRFVREVTYGYDSQQASQGPTKEPPKRGVYNAGDGYFDSQTGQIRSYDGLSLVATPNALLANWIVTQCKREAPSDSKNPN